MGGRCRDGGEEGVTRPPRGASGPGAEVMVVQPEAPQPRPTHNPSSTSARCSPSFATGGRSLLQPPHLQVPPVRPFLKENNKNQRERERPEVAAAYLLLLGRQSRCHGRFSDHRLSAEQSRTEPSMDDDGGVCRPAGIWAVLVKGGGVKRLLDSTATSH